MEEHTQEIFERALSVPDRAKLIIISDNHTLEQAGDILVVIKGLRKEVDAAFDPIISKAHAAHKEAVAQKKRADAPLVEAEGYLKPQISRYYDEQERIRLEAERQAQAEARKLAEEEQLRAAEEAEAAGDKEEAEAILEEPTVAPVVVIPKAVPKVEGISQRTVWKFRIKDEEKIPRKYMMPDKAAIGKVATGLKSKANIPGIEVYPETSTTARSR